MRLVIRRTQQAMKGMMGGHKGVQFSLSYWLQLTPEEEQLVREYKLENYPVTYQTVQGTQVPNDTIGNMRQGRSQTLTDVTTLINNEQVVKNACDALPPLFQVARTFGGDEVVDYPRQS